MSWIGTRRGAVRVVSCVEGREGEEEKAIYLDFSIFNESFSRRRCSFLLSTFSLSLSLSLLSIPCSLRFTSVLMISNEKHALSSCCFLSLRVTHRI